MRLDVSVVVPVYNEEGSLAALASELRATLGPREESYEILFVDDGSDDRSPAILATLMLDDPRVRVLRLPGNRGKSAALDAGFRRARGAIVVTLDADLQNDPADIPRLLAALEDRDVASGVRRQRLDSLTRRWSSRLANALRRLVTRDGLRDSACGLGAYRREILLRIPMFHGMHRFLPTLARLAGGRIREVPVSHRPRACGRAKYGLRNRVLRTALDLLAVRWMQRRWIDRSGTREASRDRIEPRERPNRGASPPR